MPSTRALNRLQTGGHGGRPRVDVADATPWHLQYERNKDCVSDDDSDDDSDSDDGSGTFNSTTCNSTLVDCHVLVRWSEIEKLVKDRMACVVCGQAVRSFQRRTVGIATEVDFFCSTCDLSETATALKSEKTVQESSTETNTSNIQDRIDYYELNWRLIMATELIGESQVAGSIIGMMLDLTSDAFRNKWTEMELQLGVEQVKIGERIVAWNLKKETMGKTAVMCDGVAKYPCSVSYDMGWQKASKTYDSLSGQGLCIGFRTKRVVAVQNYSKVCSICYKHSKAMSKSGTPDVAVRVHACPRNHDGSSKGMEAKAALACVTKVWSRSETSAFIDIICIDDDASTRAYLSHSFADLDENNLPRPTTKAGVPKTAKRDDKGRLPKNHPVIKFLADLCHRVRTFGKYLWRLKNLGKKKSEINVVDCLRLKRNYAWWLFSGRTLSFEEFQLSCRSPILHHFNDHSTCGTWCQHRGKSEAELAKLTKYRSKQVNNQLYLLICEIIDRFSHEDKLRECHHQMHSQKNEAMNKSIMRYCPKDKTFCRTMVLTSRINLAIGIDTLGHQSFFEELFYSMGFTRTAMTLLGLRRMWKKKEYGRMYSGLRKVKRRRRIKQRDRMIEGTAKMDLDAKEGMGYSSGGRMRDESNDGNSEETKRKRKKTRTDKHANSTHTRATKAECKCGSEDHKRISSKSCPWKGLSKVEVAQKYEQRLREKVDPLNCDEKSVDPSTEPSSEATERGKRESRECEEQVQLTSKYFGASSENTK
jgi:hypothetical protein